MQVERAVAVTFAILLLTHPIIAEEIPAGLLSPPQERVEPAEQPEENENSAISIGIVYPEIRPTPTPVQSSSFTTEKPTPTPTLAPTSKADASDAFLLDSSATGTLRVEEAEDTFQIGDVVIDGSKEYFRPLVRLHDMDITLNRYSQVSLGVLDIQ